MLILKTRWFHRWARKTSLSDTTLLAAVAEMERGLIGDALGGFVFRKRVALPGTGKRGSTRTIVVYKRGAKVFFMFGYAKNARSNISPNELKALKRVAAKLLAEPPAALEKAINDGELIEVSANG